MPGDRVLDEPDVQRIDVDIGLTAGPPGIGVQQRERSLDKASGVPPGNVPTLAVPAPVTRRGPP
jgi:hypothetical protein